jgi:DNA-directed RNA polymerase subunit beta
MIFKKSMLNNYNCPDTFGLFLALYVTPKPPFGCASRQQRGEEGVRATPCPRRGTGGEEGGLGQALGKCCASLLPKRLRFALAKANPERDYYAGYAGEVSEGSELIRTNYILENFQRSNQDTCLSHKPAVLEGSWVQSGDLLTDCTSSIGGELCLGQNILIAYMPWEGYNFEDAILISDRLVIDDLYTSVHIERYETQIHRTKLGVEEITQDIPDIAQKEIQNLDSFGIVKVGTWVEEGDVLVGKITPINKKKISPYQKLLYTILEKQIKPFRDSSLRAPRGIKAKVIDIKFLNQPLGQSKLVSTLSPKPPFFTPPEGGGDRQGQGQGQGQREKATKQRGQRQLGRAFFPGEKNNMSKNRYQYLLQSAFNPYFIFPFEKEGRAPKPLSVTSILTPKGLGKGGEEGVNDGCAYSPSGEEGASAYQRGEGRATRELESHYPFFTPLLALTLDLSPPSGGKGQGSATKGWLRGDVQASLSQPLRGLAKVVADASVANPPSVGFNLSLFPHRVGENKEKRKAIKNLYINKILKPLGPRFFKLSPPYLLEVSKVQLLLPLPPEGGLRAAFPSLGHTLNQRKNQRHCDFWRHKLTKISTIHIYLAEKRKIQIGDKMAGRHGNKGIVSQILPIQDMPYLPDGTPIDMVLNPLGVPSRMNVGQIYECLLGLAGKYLGEHFKVFAFDEMYGPEASRSFVFNKLYDARQKTSFNWLFDPNAPGKMRLYDGRSGKCFHQKVTVGQAYILRLVHMVDDKMHMRSTGPYSLVTQQPLRGRSKQGGQRLGEMEVWALEGYGAAFILLEMLTIKSDDMTGRMTLWSNLILNKEIAIGTPESFKVLVCELQALCLDIGLYRLKNSEQFDNKKQPLLYVTPEGGEEGVKREALGNLKIKRFGPNPEGVKGKGKFYKNSLKEIDQLMNLL